MKKHLIMAAFASFAGDIGVCPDDWRLDGTVRR